MLGNNEVGLKGRYKGMKRIIIRDDGRYISHGIGYTEHDGYSGTSDSKGKVSQKSCIAYQLRCINPGEQYQLEVNDKVKGIFTK